MATGSTSSRSSPTARSNRGSSRASSTGSQYGQQYAGYTGYQVQNHPQSTTALVLGLVGLIGGCLCGLPLLVSPFAWAISARVKREIAASHGQLGGEGNAQAGFIMGIIGTALLVVAVIAVIGLLAVGFATDSTSSVTSQY